MNDSFTLRQLIAKRPCAGEFTKLLAFKGISYDGELQLTRRALSGIPLVNPANASLFTPQQLDTVISQEDVVAAAAHTRQAAENLMWCYVAGLCRKRFRSSAHDHYAASVVAGE